MMDGRVLRLRQGLDAAGFHNVESWAIRLNMLRLLRSVSWCFRQRTKKADVVVPKDKKTYQMDYANRLAVKGSPLGCWRRQIWYG
jgi:porphobilinogen synthase